MTSTTAATPASSATSASASRSRACRRAEAIVEKRMARSRSRGVGRRLAFVLLASPPIACASGCGSGSAVKAPAIGPARSFELANFRPTAPVPAGKQTTISFTIRQPSGRPLTAFKRGPGPHTGVHLIIVREDLSLIVHRHPPVAGDGSVRQPIVLPAAGPYRMIVDVYPNLPDGPPNFQLVSHLNVAGGYHPVPPPPFRREQTVDGVHFTIAHPPHLKAISPALLTVSVRRADGSRAGFTPWYGALAHAIFFREGSLDYFHTHVCAPGAANCTSAFGATSVTGRSSTPGKLTVGVLVPIAGTWRLFLQTKVDGRVLTAPFTLEVH
jgi:hypothetical protein